MFNYILVVSTGYILLISVRPMLKVKKKKKVLLAVLYLQIYLKITLGCKSMVAFYSTVQKFHWLFCVGVLNSQHCE